MLEAFFITFREGLEAFLIVAIMVAFLGRSGRKDAYKAVYMGGALAVILSCVLGMFLVSIVDNPVTEGVLAIVAAALVATMTVQMMRSGHKMKKQIEDKMAISLEKTSFLGLGLIAAFTMLMITREGMETVLFMSALVAENRAFLLILGAVLGVIAALAVGVLWLKYQHRINLGRFMQVAALFLLLFCLQLFLYGIYELSEVNALPFVNNVAVHEVSKVFSGHSFFAQILGYALIAVPLLWLFIGRFRKVSSKT